MSLQPGTKLGVYEITAKIGAGGMGEVYRAHDTTLDRDVAIKVLPDAFATDPERLARFEREAKVLASLNHPNIAAIYGLEKSGETPALILELVEGPTLQDLISPSPGLRPSSPPSGERSTGKPLPLEEALPIARQIAEALEAAHEQGIIHRDLKPANVKVKSDGTVKVLDFGLAKAIGPDLSDTEAANSPTMTMTAAATKMGVIMGTAAYMAPEQAKGRQVDKRADIWAFGVLLFEMLTGRQAFGGTDISETLAAVLKTDLDLDALPEGTPRGVRRVLRRCLQKDRAQRSRDIGDVRLDLSEAEDDTAVATSTEPTESQPSAFWQRPTAAAAIAVGVALAAGFAAWTVTRPPDAAPPRVVRFSIPLVEQLGQLRGTQRRFFAIAPTGDQLVYAAGTSLFLRRLDDADAVPIAAAEGVAAIGPIFSPDGQWVAYFSRDRWMKAAIAGGPAVTLAQGPSPRGMSWGDDDAILVGRDRGILRVPAAGGEPELVVPLEGATLTGTDPQLLPDGRHLLFTLVDSQTLQNRVFSAQMASTIAVASLDTGEYSVLVGSGTGARYLPTGHLVYVFDGTIFAAPFDAERRELTGTPVSLVEGISQTQNFGIPQYDVSDDGTLVYVSGSHLGITEMVWVDRSGSPSPPIPSEPDIYSHIRLSPDQRRIVSDAPAGVWVLDVERGARLLVSPRGDHPIWTPDGEAVTYSQAESIFVQPADGSGQSEEIVTGGQSVRPISWTPDGQTLLFEAVSEDTGLVEIWTAQPGADVAPFLQGAQSYGGPQMSPDGRWVAYVSSETGRMEVYVQPFPGPGGRVPISTDGGRAPVWTRGGREIVYRNNDAVMAVTIETEPEFRAGLPELLFEGAFLMDAGPHRRYDAAADGDRFLMARFSRADATYELQVVLNWTQELLERVPVP